MIAEAGRTHAPGTAFILIAIMRLPMPANDVQPATRPSKVPRRVLHLWTLRLPFWPELLRQELRQQLRASERTAQSLDGCGDTVFIALRS